MEPRAYLQCLVLVHGQLRPFRHWRSHSEPARQGPVQGLLGRLAPQGRGQPLHHRPAQQSWLRDRRVPLQELGRVRRARRPEDGLRLHRLRRRRQGNLPGLAGPADVGPLGRSRPGWRRGPEAEKRAAFVEAYRMLNNRISLLPICLSPASTRCPCRTDSSRSARRRTSGAATLLSRAAPRGRGGGHGPARHRRRRLGHHGRAADRRRRPRPACQHHRRPAPPSCS